VHARYATLAEAKKQDLRLEPAEAISHVEGDQRAISRILDNLVSNAIKFTPSGGTIELRAQQHGEHVQIEVLDTGPGLSPSDLERVFLFPQRLSAVATEGEDQHGLGLVNVHRLVTAMGGRISVENRLRQGARFVVELPSSCQKRAEAE
jgi:signal transduction histidine kinase